MEDSLYVWADTTNLGAGDHTWVTTYKPGHGLPDRSQSGYWYCWGDPHADARLLGRSDIGAHFAHWVAEAFNPKDDVGLKYLRDGVCHQMANRLLRFTDNGAGQPIMADDATGYEVTLACYGEYGGKTRFSPPSVARDWELLVTRYIEEHGGK
jgi:hypothetical protein